MVGLPDGSALAVPKKAKQIAPGGSSARRLQEILEAAAVACAVVYGLGFRVGAETHVKA